VKYYFKNSRHLPDDVPNLLRQGILFIESVTGKVFGGSPPLMVSVRSGAQLLCQVLWKLF